MIRISLDFEDEESALKWWEGLLDAEAVPPAHEAGLYLEDAYSDQYVLRAVGARQEDTRLDG